MRQWLRLRDARCTFPACNNHSLDNDADHILAWADGGGTGVANLGQPCPKHHRLKHTTAWRPVGATRESPPGWISPTGRSYPSEHQDWEPPHWPEPQLALKAGQDSPEPQDWLEPPDWPDATAGFEGFANPEGVIDPDSFDVTDAFEGPEPVLPIDPWPDWSSSTAA
jgi:hypothetical protein